MKVDYVDGWYEITHNPGYSKVACLWKPRQDWCETTLLHGEWELQDVQYEFIHHPTDNSKNQITTKKQLTWRFKKKEDAMLFAMRWC